MTRAVRRLLLVGAIGLAALAGVSSPAAAATSGCVTIGGSPASGSGPNRATIVVDTGSGAVWSACISFSGEISGIEALERADSVITDLDPVFDQYAGIGKAVCRLRGVGTDPPDCLGKDVKYWSFSHNGKVAPMGASAVEVHDGDVQGWRYGTGGLPRAATDGTKATTAPPPITSTTRPHTTTPPPSVTTTAPRGSSTPGNDGPTPTTPDGSPVPTTTTVGGTSTTTPAGDASTTTTSKDEEEVVEGATDDQSAEGAAGDGGDDQADESAAASASSSGDGSGGGSSLGSAAGFAVALALVGGAAVLVRRRRGAVPEAPTS